MPDARQRGGGDIRSRRELVEASLQRAGRGNERAGFASLDVQGGKSPPAVVVFNL